MALDCARFRFFGLTRRVERLRTHAAVTTVMRVFLGIALCMCFFAGSLRGQAVWSTVLGYVADPSGAAIPGAEVIVTNEQTGVVNKGTTDSTGSFNVTHLDPGAYDLGIEAKGGFKRFSQTGIQLAVGA